MNATPPPDSMFTTPVTLNVTYRDLSIFDVAMGRCERCGAVVQEVDFQLHANWHATYEYRKPPR